MTKKNDTAPPGSLVIAETSTSTWSYHLRRVGPDGRLYLGGSAPPALCGRSLGWDTKQPLVNWAKKSHIPESWCADCNEIASDELIKTALLPAMDIAKKGLKPDGYVSMLNFKSLGTLEGKTRHKTRAAAARAVLTDLGELPNGTSFIVGRVHKSASFANGCFTEVFVLGDVSSYEIVDGVSVSKEIKERAARKAVEKARKPRKR